MKKRFIKIAVALILAALIAPALIEHLPVANAAKQQSSAEIKQEIDKMEQEQAALEESLKELEKLQSANRESMEEMVAQKGVLDQQVSVLNTQINNINERIAAQTLLIANKQIELEQSRTNLALMRQQYKKRIRAMEEGGTVSYWAVLFEASSFSDLLDRINMIQEIAEADTKRIEALDKATQEVENAKLALDAEKRTLDKNKKEMEGKRVQLAKKQEEANAILAELLAKGQEYEDLVAKTEEQKEELQEALEAMELKLTEAQKREYEEELRRQEALNGTTRPIHEKDGIKWAEPCDYGRVSSPFGYRFHPVTGVWKGHTGVDLTRPSWAVKTGEKVPIYATRSGVVVFAGWDSGGGGNYVSIDHLDDYKSQYMHLDSIVVKKGDKVTIGQLIGYMGDTGVGTGIHLHFVIRHYEKYDAGNGVMKWGYRPHNPAEYIKFR